MPLDGGFPAPLDLVSPDTKEDTYSKVSAVTKYRIEFDESLYSREGAILEVRTFIATNKEDEITWGFKLDDTYHITRHKTPGEAFQAMVDLAQLT